MILEVAVLTIRKGQEDMFQAAFKKARSRQEKSVI